jgi:predicted lipoprotein with Yx(FWY)xxD motif
LSRECTVDELGTPAVRAENSNPDVVYKPQRPLVRLGAVAVGAAAVALLAAACSGSTSGNGNGNGNGNGYGSGYGVGTTSAGPATTSVVGIRASGVGQTLVDGQGNTLYLFEADRAGESTCNAACAAVWPPYLGGSTVQAGTGVTASLLSTITRGDGGRQVAYGGHPLYRYAGDNAPGDLRGQGLDQFGAKWFVLGPTGSEIGGQ